MLFRSITYNNGITYVGGTIVPLYANVSLGSANAPFNNIYTSNSTVVFSNTNVTVSGTLTSNNITANSIILTNSGLYQYNTSNNSTVTQATSKSTGVTCNGRTGQITTSNSSLGKGVVAEFTVTNNQIISAKDVVIVNIASGATAATYSISVTAVTPGSFNIAILNNGTGATTDTLVLNFAIIRVN